MRLIDADALLHQIRCGYTEYPVMIEIRNALEKFIDEAPTIEPERKKGKWKEVESCGCYMSECSACGSLYRASSSYCPICGADMRGDSDEI